MDITKELSAKITPLIGYRLDEDHIHQCDCGYGKFVRQLKPGYPVFLMHYRGPLVLLIPDDDYRRLEAEEMTTDEFIASSHFSYGYYLGGNSLFGGSYWQPLEDDGATGIHSTERISRYLNILHCQSELVASYCVHPELVLGRHHSVKAKKCRDSCPLSRTGCPLSALNETGNWDEEVQEPDGRYELFLALRERLRTELGFEACDLSIHSISGTPNQLHLVPFGDSSCRDMVEVRVDVNLLNDLLYHPGERDWQEMAASFTELVAQRVFPRHWEHTVLDADDKREQCLNFWSGDNAFASWWNTPADVETTEDTSTGKDCDADDDQVAKPVPFLLRVIDWLLGRKRID